MANRKRQNPTPDLFAIPRTLAEARRESKAIGVRVSKARVASIREAERLAKERVRKLERKTKPKKKKKAKPKKAKRFVPFAEEREAIREARRRRSEPVAPTRVELTPREREQVAEQRQLLADELVRQRIQAVRDSIRAGASLEAVIVLTKGWGLPPDLWLDQDLLDEWDEDLSMHDVFDKWHDSPREGSV